MAGVQHGSVLRGLGGSFPSGSVGGLSDGALPGRYVDRRDALAFAALLALGVSAPFRVPGSGAERPTTTVPAQAPANPPPAADDAAKAGAFGGVVLDVEGKPVAGAQVYLYVTAGGRTLAHPKARSGPDGRFRFDATEADLGAGGGASAGLALAATAAGYGPDWVAAPEPAPPGGRRRDDLVLRLEPDGVTVKGRILDIDTRPIAGALVAPRALHLRKNGKGETVPFFGAEAEGTTTVRVPVNGLIPAVRTDGRGAFRLTGIGDDRMVDLRVTRPGIATETIRASTCPGTSAALDPAEPYDGTLSKCYSSVFVHATEYSRTIEGVVRGRDNGEPIAGATLEVYGMAGQGPRPEAARADAEGRFRLEGLSPHVFSYSIRAHPPDGLPYFAGLVQIPTGPGRRGLVRADVELERGVAVSGRVADAATGRPVGGYVYYMPLTSNPNVNGFKGSLPPHATLDGNGRYTLPALPGRGVVYVRARRGLETPYRPARPNPEGDGRLVSSPDDPLLLDTALKRVDLDGYNAYRVIDPAAGDESIACDLTVDPGRSLTGTVVDPDGGPLDGVTVFGLDPLQFDGPGRAVDRIFTARALDPGDPRRVFFHHEGRRLAGHVDLTGDEIGPVVARLEPCATVVGRFVNGAGRPVAKVHLYRTYDDPDGAPHVDFPPGRRVQSEAERRRIAGESRAMLVFDDPVRQAAGDDGRFRLDDLVPGVRVTLRGQSPVAAPLIDRALRPGEVVDLGNVGIEAVAPNPPAPTRPR